MRVIKVLVALLATVVFFGLLAQSDADYSGWMKAAVAAKGKVAKGIAAKDKAVATDAKVMEDSFKGIEDYWTKKGAADATGFAKTARTASADIAKATAAGDFDAANAAMMTLGTTCGGCHMAHRGAKGADGSYPIK
jgi:cytochrome c556